MCTKKSLTGLVNSYHSETESGIFELCEADYVVLRASKTLVVANYTYHNDEEINISVEARVRTLVHNMYAKETGNYGYTVVIADSIK